MKVETYKCNECGKSRDSDSNHWYVVAVNQSVEPHVMSVQKFTTRQPEHWDHVCGQECLHKAIDRMLVAV